MRINSVVSSNQNFKGIKPENEETKNVLRERMCNTYNPSGYTLVCGDDFDISQVTPVGQELAKMETLANEIDKEGDCYISKDGDSFCLKDSKGTILAKIDDGYEDYRGSRFYPIIRQRLKTSSILKKLNAELAKIDAFNKAKKQIENFFN